MGAEEAWRQGERGKGPLVPVWDRDAETTPRPGPAKQARALDPAGLTEMRTLVHHNRASQLGFTWCSVKLRLFYPFLCMPNLIY